MNFNFKCSVCGEAINAHVSKVENFIDVEVTVEPHECREASQSVTLSEAIQFVDGDSVELGYFKKDGSFVTMRGYFKHRPLTAKIGYEFFLKEVGQCFEPRNLLRRGITSIYHISRDFTYLIR